RGARADDPDRRRDDRPRLVGRGARAASSRARAQRIAGPFTTGPETDSGDGVAHRDLAGGRGLQQPASAAARVEHDAAKVPRQRGAPAAYAARRVADAPGAHATTGS